MNLAGCIYIFKHIIYLSVFTFIYLYHYIWTIKEIESKNLRESKGVHDKSWSNKK